MVYTDRILSNFFKLTFIIIFGLLGFGIIGLAMGNTLGVFFTFLISIYFLEKRVFSIRNAIKPIFLKKEIIFFSAPLMLSSLMHSILARVDTLMIGYFRTASEVGVYNAAIPTSQLLYYGDELLGHVISPRVNRTLCKKSERVT